MNDRDQLVKTFAYEYVHFNHDPDHAYLVTDVTDDCMLELEGMSGLFAPSLFKRCAAPAPPVQPESEQEVSCPDCVEGKLTAGCSTDKPLISVDCGRCKGTGRFRLPTIDLPLSMDDIKRKASAAATPSTTAVPWRDEGDHAWEIRPNLTCVECPHCCFTFAAIHGDTNGYDCPNCEGCPEAKREPVTTTAAARDVAVEILEWLNFDTSLDAVQADVYGVWAILSKHFAAVPVGQESAETWATIKQTCGFCGQCIEHVCTAFLKHDAAAPSPDTSVGEGQDKCPVCNEYAHANHSLYKLCNNCWGVMPWREDGRVFHHKPYPYTCAADNEIMVAPIAATGDDEGERDARLRLESIAEPWICVEEKPCEEAVPVHWNEMITALTAAALRTKGEGK